MVEEFTRGDKLVLVPNPHYWELGVDCQPLPYLDKITIAYVPESNSRILGLRNGDFNAVSGVPYNEAANLDADEDIVLHVAPIYRLDYVYLNHLAPPLDSEEFRLALNYALDRQAIIDNVFFGYGQLPNAFWPLMNFNSDDVPLIPYDPDKARELLDEAGYSGEALEVLLAAGESSDKQIATILQQFWSAVGINVELVEVDSSFSLVAEGEYQAAVGYITSDINDDDELTTLQATLDNDTSSFFTWYDNPEVGPLLAQARESLDPEVRADLYAQVQEMVYWDGYSVPLNYTPAVNAIGTNVRNWQNLTTGWWWLRTVWLDQ
jgi:peptide/nickel transport system substrate-binding protein